MRNDMTKVYAAYLSGCLGRNVLEAYFPFLANIICDENWSIIDETQVRSKFQEKYNIPVPLSFVRQVLGVGVRNRSIVDGQGRYNVVKEEMRKYQFDVEPFSKKWDQLIKEFSEYCKNQDFTVSEEDIETNILDTIEDQDKSLILGDGLEAPRESDVFNYAWHKFIKKLSQEKKGLFDFVVAISASNIFKQAVFFTGDGRGTFKGLNVYIDSPIAFALLGVDSSERTESCQYLLRNC